MLTASEPCADYCLHSSRYRRPTPSAAPGGRRPSREATQITPRRGQVSPSRSGRADAEPGGRPLRRRAGHQDLAGAEVIQFSTQLAVMVETGVTLSEALDCIASQTDKPNVKRAGRAT